jgi:O-antigen ligase
VLRDFALTVYPLFILLGLYIFEDWAGVRRFCICFVMAASLSGMVALFWFMAVPQQRRYIFTPPYVLACLIALLLCTSARLIRPWLGWGLGFLLGTAVVLTNARSVYVAFACVMAVAFFTVNQVSDRVQIARMKLLASVGIVVLVLLSLMYSTGRGTKLLSQTSQELVSGTLNFRDDANASFRFMAWAEAIRRFLENPLTGEGFGVPFTFESEDYDSRPHNTFLTVLYKMGLFGFATTFALLCHLYICGWKAIRRHRCAESFLLFALLLGHLGMTLYGMFSLLFESPFLASGYWLVAGVAYRLISLQDRGHSRPMLATS